MDKSDYFKKIWANGRLIVGYTALKAFETNTALTLARLNTEYNYSVGHGYLINNFCFPYDENEIAVHIGLCIEDVQTAIMQLENLNLIKVLTLESHNLVHLYLDNICDYIAKKEEKNHFSYWDSGLETIQKNAYINFEFDSENKKIVEDWGNEDFELATDEFGNPLKF